MRFWADILPPDIARAQHGYERRRRAVQMREIGMTLAEIGRRLGVGPSRVREMIKKQHREYGNGRRQPVEIYLGRGWEENAQVCGWLKS